MNKLRILQQPTPDTGGQTSLHAIYQYYGHTIALDKIIAEVERVSNGGTLAPFLGVHALNNGFDAVIYAHNLKIFDPSWFKLDKCAPDFLIQKLQEQRPYQQDDLPLCCASLAFEKFLKAGGQVHFRDLNTALLRKYLTHQRPILAGVSATYLYGSAREIDISDGSSIADDIRGRPSGHFMVLCDYFPKDRSVSVADPRRNNPIEHDLYYRVAINRLINAILLGVFTYDANLLVLTPRVQGKIS